jgi:hypothetical protein
MESMELLLIKLTDLADREGLQLTIKSASVLSSAAKYEIILGEATYYTGRLNTESLSDALLFFALNIGELREMRKKENQEA